VDDAYADHHPALVVDNQCAPFIRGDANADGAVNIADPVSTLDVLFSMGSVPCDRAQDSNNDDSVDIADAIYTLTYLFDNGPPPSSPFPNCGIQASTSNLSCDSFPFCP
jgi:hypothetical protein